MNVLQEIKNEHQQFRDLIAKIEKAKGAKKATLFKELYAGVIGHHEAEEQVLFKDIKKMSDKKGQSIVLEMIEEHSLINYQFSLVQKTGIDNESWDAKFSVLKEILTHHLDEEEKELFKQAKKVLTKKEITEKYQPFEDIQETQEKKQTKKLHN